MPWEIIELLYIVIMGNSFIFTIFNWWRALLLCHLIKVENHCVESLLSRARLCDSEMGMLSHRLCMLQSMLTLFGRANEEMTGRE